MSGHIRELWEAVGLPEEYHIPDHRAIARRVDAQLDAVPSERKRYMRQKLRLAAVLTAAAVALTGAALGVVARLDALSAHFRGDTAPVEDLLDSRPRSVTDEHYTFTVESSISDGREAFLVVRADARTAQAAEKLMRDDFVNMDTFSIYAVKDPTTPLPEDLGVEEKTGVNIPQMTGAHSMGEVMAARTETSRTWRSSASLPEEEVAYIRVRLCYMAPDQVVEVPLTPAESVTLEIGARGQGLPTYENDVGGPITVEQITLSPFTCRVAYARHDRTETEPRIFFRMTDGTLCTQSQMMHFTSGEGRPGSAVWNYQFNQVLDLSQLKAIVVFGWEYPMDGSAPTEVTVDPALDIFKIPLMPRLSEGGGYSIPVRALCAGLEADYEWEEETNSAVLTYRGVTLRLTPGSKTATANGQTVELTAPVGMVEGQISSDHQIFQDHWGVDSFVYRTRNPDKTDTWHDWIVIP